MSTLQQLRETLLNLDSALEDYSLNGESSPLIERAYVALAIGLLDDFEAQAKPLAHDLDEAGPRQAIQRAFDNIGKAIDCCNEYMPVDYDGVRRTRHGLEQSYSELAAILGVSDGFNGRKLTPEEFAYA